MVALLDYKVLVFDVYGTIVNWDEGIVKALRDTLDPKNEHKISHEKFLSTFQAAERPQLKEHPKRLYRDIVATSLAEVAGKLGLLAPSEEQTKAFGASVGTWPPFPDSIDALKRLSKHYKLVVLSNIDHVSFNNTNSGPLENFPFDLVLVAEDIGSYKPDMANFRYMTKEVQEKLGFKSDKIIMTAHGQLSDHYPAREMGIKGSWIVRPGTSIPDLDEYVYDWKFDTLGEMADAMEKEVAAK